MNDTEFRILGPLEVVVDGRAVPLGGRKQRALLAVLIVRAGSIVTADTLIEEVWGADAPATVRAGLHVYLSRLRRVLGSGDGDRLIARRGHGYTLLLDAARLDANRFERLAREGRGALAAGDPRRATELLTEALSLWRGPVLADLADEPFVQSEARRLEDLRLQALESRVESDLQRGRFSEVVAELEALTTAHPYRERLRGHQMVALYQSGRQAESLEVYRMFRQTLRDELGLEPSPDLDDLHMRILRHDGSLAPAPREDLSAPRRGDPEWSGRRHMRRGPVGAALVVVAALGVVGVTLALLARREEAPPGAARVRVPSHSVASLDPSSGELRQVWKVGRRPAGLVVGAGAVWVGSPDNDVIVRIDPERESVERFGIGLAPGTLAAGAGGLWIVDESQIRLAKLDPEHPTDVTSIEVPTFGRLDPIRGVAVAAGAAWYVQSTTPTLHRVGTSRNSSTRTVRLAGTDAIVSGSGTASIGADGDTLWASYAVTKGYTVGGGGPGITVGGLVARVDARTGRVTGRAALAGTPSAIASGQSGVWIAVPDEDRIWRLNRETGVAERAIHVPGGPFAVAVGRGSVWVLTLRRNALLRIDPDRARVDLTIQLGRRPVAVATGLDAVWVAVSSS